MRDKHLGCIAAMLCSWLVLFSVPARSQTKSLEKASGLPQGPGVPLSKFLRPDGTLNLPHGPIQGSIDVAGFQMVTGPGSEPRFVETEGGPAHEAADGGDWDPRFNPRGMNNSVAALAWDGTNLYAGGDFTTAGDVTANYIAMWNGSAWSTLGTGMNGTVYALAWDGTNLYAGGSFTTAGGVAANCIAMWNGSAWSALDTGISSLSGHSVDALAWDGMNLYAGGFFTTAGGVTANCIAKWNGSAWSALGTGLNGTVYALAWDGTNLYAGGSFTTAGGVAANSIAIWNGSAWNDLGTGMGGDSPVVFALAWDGTNIYAGGYFTTAGGVSTSYIAKWNGSAWNALGTGVSWIVYALAWDGTDLYAGGGFMTADGVTANHIATWNGTMWNSLGNGMGGGGYATVSALSWEGTNLYVGGDFVSAGIVTASNIAQWNGSTWSPMPGAGEGIGMLNVPNQPGVMTLAWDGTNLYAGGNLTTAGDVTANGVAKWDGTTWSPLGAGLNGRVNALASDGTNLYAGGSFTTAGGVAANCIAKWNGSAWSALGTGMGGVYPVVKALAWDGANLYAGGYFNTAGGVTANCIAQWNGSAWSALGAGIDGGEIYALAWDGTNLYAGGYFVTAGGVTANNIAQWNGSVWSALGWGSTYFVNALAWDGTNLYAGAYYTATGGMTAGLIAKWNGSAWSPLGTGLDNMVRSLAWDGTNLWGSGDFTIAGSKPSSYIGRWSAAPAGPVVTGVSPSNGPAAGGTSVVITGSGFTGATVVSFGGTAATFTVQSDTQIAATSPAHGPGAVDATVTTANGTSATSSADQFTYTASGVPTVTGVSPSSGSAAGGTSVVITGGGFTGATVVSFGGTVATFTLQSDAQIAATSPAHAAGTVDVTVTTANGTSATSSADQFTYTAPQPVVTSISPTSGPASGGTNVTVTGSGFTGASSVLFGSIAATEFAISSDSSLTAVSPPQAAGTVYVTVTTGGGTSGTGPSCAFQYTVAVPVVASVTPGAGPTTGGASVTILGAGFTGASAVMFGSSNAASFAVQSDGSVVAVTPAHGAGTVDVTVTTPGGTNAVSTADQYTFTVNPPSVSSVNPASGPAAGGTSIVIQGQHLGSATSVTFGGAGASFAINSDTQIKAVSPAHMPGTVDIVVTSPLGSSGTGSFDEFTYVQPPPVLSNVSPAKGSSAGGTVVMITGTGFLSGCTVSFGGIVASVTSQTGGLIVTSSPPHTVGTVDVAVTNPDGQTAFLSGAFTYIDPPVILGVSKASNPFRLKIIGQNFKAGCVIKVNGVPVPATKWKSDARLVARGGARLKALIPLGLQVDITALNVGDGIESSPYAFSR